MAANVYINDVDIETFAGLSILAVRGWADAVEYARSLVPVPGRSGSVAQALASGQPRTVVVDVLITASALADRQATLDNLLGFCQGAVDLRFADGATKEVSGVLKRAPVTTQGGGESTWALPWLRASLEFECSDGAFYTTTNSTATCTATAVAVALGTLPSGGTIVVTGAATNPTLTYKNNAGTTIGTMGFTLSLAGGQTLTVDLGLRTIYKNVGSGEVAAYDAWTSGSWFAPSPADGSYKDSLWPTIQCSSGSAVYTYKKAWRS